MPVQLDYGGTAKAPVDKIVGEMFVGENEKLAFEDHNGMAHKTG
jgi:hypothetical protein